jgi:hypothetical protein
MKPVKKQKMMRTGRGTIGIKPTEFSSKNAPSVNYVPELRRDIESVPKSFDLTRT